MNAHTEGKQEVSSLTWLFGFAVSWFISCLVVKSIYELNDSSLNGSGLIAIGSVLAVIYFSMTSKASLNKFGRFLLWVGVFAYCLVVVPVEVFSLFTNNMSNSGGGELEQKREIKETAINKTKKLEARQDLIWEDNKMSGATKTYKAGQLDELIAKQDSRANSIIPSNQSKTFDDMGKRFGIDNIESIYKSVMAALLVFVMPLLNISRNGTWCGLTLLIHKLQTGVMGWMMKEKSTEIKNVSPADLDIKGGEEKEPTGKHKTGGDYEAAKTLIEKEFERGLNIPAKKLKAATGTTADFQQKGIIGLLIDNGIVIKKGASVKKYYRTTVKEQAEKTMKNTSKFLKLVSVK